MNKNLKISILIAVLISAVFSGYFAWNFLKKQKSGNNQQNGQISDLKTYRNEKYGFEFQYPKEIVISDSDTEEGDLYFEFCNDVSCFMAPDFFEIKNTEITYIDQLTKNLYYSDYCGELNEEGEPIPGSGLVKDRKVISSLDGKKGVLFYSSEYEDGGCTIIQFLNEKKLFSFVIANWKEKKLDEAILSSFKFIKNSASDLKTYRNEKYGFEFQYPEKKLNLHEYQPNNQINKFKNMVLDLGYHGPYGGFGEISVYNTNFQFIDSIMKEGRFRNIIFSKDSNFDNRPGKIFTGKIINFNGEGYEDVFYKTILIQYADDKVIGVWGPSYTNANKEQDVLFDEIVSTLKFIN